MQSVYVLAHVVIFEARQRLSRPWFWALLAGIAVLGGAIASFFSDGETGAISPGKLNSGYLVTYALMTVLLAGTFPVAVLGSDLVRRAHEDSMADIFESSPTPGWLIFLARYLAQLAFGLLIALAGAIGYEFGCRMPWISPGLAGSIAWKAWIYAFAILALPTLGAISALAMLVAASTANRWAQWGLPIAVYMLLPVSFLLVRKGYPGVGPWFDPLGTIAVLSASILLTPAEQLVWHVKASGIVLTNRQIWITIAFLGLVGGMVQASRRTGSERIAKLLHLATQRLAEFRPWPRNSGLFVPTPAAPPPAESLRRLRLSMHDAPWAGFKVFLARIRFELAAIARSIITLLLIALPTLAAIPVLIFGSLSETDKLPLLPVTALLIPKLEEAVIGTTSLFVVIFAGEMIWRERQARMDELIDAMALPPFAIMGGKLAALAVVVAAQFLIVCLIGIVWQIVAHTPQLNIGHYAARFFLVDWTGALMLGALSMLVHALIGMRIAAHLVAIGLLFVIGDAEALGIEHHLLIYASVPKFAYSDMNGLGHYLKLAVVFTAYWGTVASVLFILADLVRARGADTALSSRFRALAVAPRGAMQALLVAAFVAVLMGGYIFWNTNVRGDYVNSSSAERIQIGYEKAFGNFVTQPQPRVSSLDLVLDIYPERRRYRAHGDMLLHNPTSEPIARFFVEGDVSGFELKVPEAKTVSRPAVCCAVYEVALKAPLMPGDTISLSFSTEQHADGAWTGDALNVHENGTRLDSEDVAPIIGVHHGRFLRNEEVREKAGLPRLRDAPGGRGSLAQSLYSPDTDQSRFAITVSTSADQTAIAPGKLVKSWKDQKGRNVFRYETEVPIDSTWTILSARYATATREWRGIPISIHYHPAHARNIELMFGGMEAGLDYCTRAFSPYQFKELRLVEYPYSGNIAATAQPGLIAYSETAGFIADTRRPGFDRAKIADVTSHEVAHQWWGYQIAPANAPGAHLLTESLAEYVAIMITRRRSENAARGMVSAHMEEYIKSRKTMSEEKPLIAVEPDAPAAVRYGKGSAAFYALTEQVGEVRLNRALAKFMQQFGGRHNPYPTSNDLVAVLKAELGPAYSGLIEDLFERITLWSFDIKAAKAEKLTDGKWRTTLKLDAQKFEADAKGNETPRTMAMRVPISVHDKDPRNPDVENTENARVEVRSGMGSVSFVTALEPKFVQINPSRSLPQRQLGRKIVEVTR